MQPLNWYIKRLRSMTAQEIAWRIFSIVQDQLDRFRLLFNIYPSYKTAGIEKIDIPEPGYRISDIPVGDWAEIEGSEDVRFSWLVRLKAKAEMIVNNRLDIFNLKNQYLGDPINWNYDFNAKMNSPVRFSPTINYRYFKEVGDCKLVWEPNRHHQFFILAKAYRVTGDEKYISAFIKQFESWIGQNPIAKGMNWRSPLELAIRLINWVWTIDLIRDSKSIDNVFIKKLAYLSYLHCWDISRKFSRGTSANNHLVGEAAGVFITASYFGCFPESAEWIDKSKKILEEEILKQSYSDGCTREQALGYQYFVLQFYIVCALVGKWTNNLFSEAYMARLKKMIEFPLFLSQGGKAPDFGDKDDGYVLDLGEPVDDAGTLQAIHKHFFPQDGNEAGFPEKATESLIWLFGKNALVNHNENEKISSLQKVKSNEFNESGHYLLQANSDDNTSISLIIDCAELGYGPIAAHGHSDALSFVLRINNEEVLIDTGTYDYFSYPKWRNYFRSTRAHNTVEIDGLDQSVMEGPFLWAKHAKAKCNKFIASENGGVFIGEHNGYLRLPDPVLHSRKIELDSAKGKISIEDKLTSKEEHSFSSYFHLGMFCNIVDIRENYCIVDINRKNRIRLETNPELSIEVISGQENPIGGWASYSYHEKSPISTLKIAGTVSNIKIINLTILLLS